MELTFVKPLPVSVTVLSNAPRSAEKLAQGRRCRRNGSFVVDDP